MVDIEYFFNKIRKEGGERMKKYLAFVLILLFVIAIFVGCSKKEDELDEDELQNAELMTSALTQMISNIGVYDDFVGEGAKFRGPPGPWKGPQSFTTPDGNTADWYFWKLAFTDSIGEDTLLFLLMQTPDIWGEDSLATLVFNVDVWFTRLVNVNFYFHFSLDIDTVTMADISGMWKWYYEGTWLEYTFTDMSIDSGDYSGTIEVNTSTNINLSAYFDFDVDGSGEGWGKWQGIKFVDYTFYAMPADPYRGYFTLASEGWNVEHEFPKQ